MTGRVARRLGWTVAALLGLLSVAGMLTIGPFVLPVALGLVAILLWTGGRGVAAGIVVAAAAYPFLLMALANAEGPVSGCRTIGAEQVCEDILDPRPFRAVAVGCFVLGSAIAVLGRRRRSRPTPPQ